MKAFTADIALLDVLTDDKRRISGSADIQFRTTPLPLRWQPADAPGHDGSVVIGAIQTLSSDGASIKATGFLLESISDTALEQITTGVVKPSVDFSPDLEWHLEDNVYVVDRAKVTGATLVAIPAFGDTTFALDEAEESVDVELLVADAFRPRFRPHRELFAQRTLDGPTRLQVDSEGYVFGHIAEWDVRHRAFDGKDVYAPRSRSDYSQFHTSVLVTSDDEQMLAGRLTVTGSHPEDIERAFSDVSTTWAYVRAYEDEYGIAVFGVLNPYATSKIVDQGVMSAPSGAWRFGELIAVLGVNTPGFPVIQGKGNGMAQELLVASFTATGTDEDSVREISRQVYSEMKAREEALALLSEMDKSNRNYANELLRF